MRTKLGKFRDDFPLLTRTSDIIVFVETNLIESISDSKVGLDNYFVQRKIDELMIIF